MELKDRKGKVIYTDYCNSYWDPSRPPCRPYDLMVRVLREKCIL